MRQVNADELLWRVRFGLGQIAPSLRRDLASPNVATRKMAEQMIAEHFVGQVLHRYEILSSAPLPDDANLFRVSAYRFSPGGADGTDG